MYCLYRQFSYCRGDRSDAHFTLLAAPYFCKSLLVVCLQRFSIRCRAHSLHLTLRSLLGLVFGKLGNLKTMTTEMLVNAPGPLIGLVGKAHAGKDAACKMLEEALPGRIARAAFADALKREVAKAFGCSVTYIEANKALFRPILQAWGVLRREVEGSWYWVDQVGVTVEHHRSRGRVVVVTDTRFENEVAWVRANGGLIVRVERPGHDNGVPIHVSETEQEGVVADYTLTASNLTQLRPEVDRLREALNL